MKKIKYTYLMAVSMLMLYSCVSKDKVPFEFDDIEVEYVYKDSPISRFYYSIYRSVKIRKASEIIKFDLLPDIERYDEARFFYTEGLLLDSIAYQRVILIRDPFALALVDLDEMTILYNSHGEDNILDRILIPNEERCIGKVTKKKFELTSCLVEF